MIAKLGDRADVSVGTSKTIHWGWWRNAVLDRVVVFLATPETLFALLCFQLFLSLGIGKTQAEFDIVLGGDHVEILEHLLGDITILESDKVSPLIYTESQVY